MKPTMIKCMQVVLLNMSLLASGAHAVTLDELQQRLASQPVIRADFVQERHIKDMGQPLRSSGQLIVSHEKGLWWQQQKPFELTLMLNDQRMVQVMKGQAPQVMTAASNPQMFQFNHLLRSIFQADRKVLEENFKLQFSDLGKGRWQLVLIPVSSPLDKLFTTITLDGAVYLDHIVLNDRQGDSTDIVFSSQRPKPDNLTAEELRRFDF